MANCFHHSSSLIYLLAFLLESNFWLHYLQTFVISLWLSPLLKLDHFQFRGFNFKSHT